MKYFFSTLINGEKKRLVFNTQSEADAELRKLKEKGISVTDFGQEPETDPPEAI